MARNSSAGKGRKSRKSTPLFPPSVHQFLARRLTDSIGGFQILLGVFLLLALISYDAGDMSFNAIGANTITNNWMGTAGAAPADLLLQSFGLSAALIPCLLLFWGVRVLKRTPQNRLAMRLTGLLVAVLGLTIALAFFNTPNFWDATAHMAGSAGVLMFNKMTGLLHPVLPNGAPLAIFGLSLLIGLTGLFIAFGMTITEWQTVRTFVGQHARRGWTITKARFFKLVKWHAHYEALSKDIEKEEKSAPRRSAPVITEPTVKSAPPKIKVEAPKKTATGTRSQAEKQPALKLDRDTDWELPPIGLLQEVPAEQVNRIDKKALEKNAELLQKVLQDFNIEGEIQQVNPGPIVTLYEFEPAPGTKSSRIINLADDIARSMSATSVRVAVIPGKNAIGIEMPNTTRETIFMREMLDSRAYELTKAKLPLILGKDIGGEPVIADLARMPHLLVAGTTGSGKSVSINTMLLSLLYRHSPEKCRLIMIDPKMLELSVYDDIPHLLTPVVTEPSKAITALKWAVHEMEDRYRAMSKLGVRNIEGYNKRILEAQKTGEIIMHKVQTGFDPQTGKPMFEEQPMNMVELPYIVIIVDEFADLMLAAGKEVENAIQRLAQMARAAGLHLIMATQRPSVDVITGVIKANFPTRISFSVTSKIDSRTILGDGGAEQLLGMGDMLYMASGGKIKRVHGPFVDDDEVEQVVSFLQDQGEPEYIESVTHDSDGFDSISGITNGDRGDEYDELYDQAVQVVITEKKASTSFIQRHLQIGYNRAARIIEQMEKDGLIGPANHVGKRQILLETVE